MKTLSPADVTAGDTRAVLLGGLASGVGAYAFTILGARMLGEVAYAPVGVLWTVQYLVLTVGLLSLEALVTRDRRATRGMGLWIGGLVLALVVGSAATGHRLFDSTSMVWPIAAGLIGLGFGVFVIGRGLAAGAADFRTYGLMSGGESLVRLVVAGIVLTITPSAAALALTLPVGALAMAAVWLIRRNQTTSEPSPLRPRTSARSHSAGFLASTTWANAVAQVLLAGGPLLTAVLQAPAAITSQVFVTTTAARAPLVLVYSGLLARMLTTVERMPDVVLRRRVLQATAGVALATVAAAGIGFTLGPPLVALAFGSGLRPGTSFAALTGAAVVMATALLAANQILIARRWTRSLLLPWAIALAAGAVAAWAVDLPPDLRAGYATVAGLSAAAVALVPVLLRATSPAESTD